MIIDCHGHYTTAPKALEAWRQRQLAAFDAGTPPPDPADLRIGDDELRGFTALYDIGEVLSCKGIAEGVENSNFLLTTERGNFILTLYEKRVAPQDLPFFIALMDHLAHHGVACPTPVRARDG